CQRLGNPQDTFKTIHIAGSKGKGSVAIMAASILTQSGFKTGIYTSPHIVDFRERISASNGFFEDRIYIQSASQIMECINSIKEEELPGGRRPTWFEIVTAYAFLCFKNAACTHVVIETGLGGRLDSTNIIKSSVTVLTRIELEHTEFLGDTLEKIAYEKAGIIKEKTPAVILDQQKKVLDVFRLKAESENAPVYISSKTGSFEVAGYEKKDDKILMNTNINCSLYNDTIHCNLKMPGQYQAENALLASIAVKLLEKNISSDDAAEGLSKAFLPGRFEVTKNPLSKNSTIILDGAHTVNSIKFTMETCRWVLGNSKKHLLFGCAADKDVEDISLYFQEEFQDVTLTRPGNVKKSDLNRMCQAFEKAEINFSFNENYNEAIIQAIKQAAEQNAVLLVTGSFYLVSEVKKTLGTLLETPQVIS
uniref:bifunctional folylpolyglutamate synthase/dihydrofolate synthase n=1 Tax=Treponema sp. TaxID=166 RepID=UPI0025ED13F4